MVEDHYSGSRRIAAGLDADDLEKPCSAPAAPLAEMLEDPPRTLGTREGGGGQGCSEAPCLRSALTVTSGQLRQRRMIAPEVIDDDLSSTLEEEALSEELERMLAHRAKTIDRDASTMSVRRTLAVSSARPADARYFHRRMVSEVVSPDDVVVTRLSIFDRPSRPARQGEEPDGVSYVAPTCQMARADLSGDLQEVAA
ncbi:hypothetical protein [Klebsiella pneumoniae]|uniref:hypothetical protein n=1 Tax=Klebsiella pneumoniae TaxID=573 RepID=UPI003D54827C